MIVDVQVRHPGIALNELHVRNLLPTGQQQQTHHKGGNRCAECQPPLEAIARRQQNDDGADYGQKR